MTKLWGAALVLSASLWAYLLWRRRSVLPLEVGQALLDGLAILRYEVCVRRTPLPELLSGRLKDGLGGAWLWEPLGASLAGEPDVRRCWESAVGRLPPPLDRLLEPVGPLLPAGGPPLETAIEETREELTRYLREARAAQAAQGRIAAAVCLSGACLLILVLI